MKYKIKDMGLIHAAMLRHSMREADKQEVWASSHRTAEEAIMKAYTYSVYKKVATKDNVMFACFGVAPVSLLGVDGSPWLLGTDLMESSKRAVVALSKVFVAEMLERYPRLENYVDTRNKISLRWLEWCGFDIEEAKPYGPDNKLFHRFTMIKEL